MSATEAAEPALWLEGEPRANCPAGELDGRDATQHCASSQTLWPFQVDVIARVKAELLATAAARVLMVIPTGGGKTVTSVQIIVAMALHGCRVLILLHRRELLQQWALKLYAAGVDCGLIAAGYPSRPEAMVQIAMVSTLHARAIRTATIDLPPADLVVVDEAHHTPAGTWSRILEAYPDAHVLGPTATPCRADGRGLGGFFRVMVRGPSMAELIASGFLAPFRVIAPAKPDLSKIRVARGDFKRDELAAAMDRPQLVGDVTTQWLRHGEGRKTIVYAVDRRHAQHIANSFGEANVVAAVIDGVTPVDERDALLRKFAAGEIQVIVNVGVFVEGTDIPDVSCIIIARPTKSIGLYLQMVGRGLRSAPGKKDCIIIDHAGVVEMHGFPDEPIAWELSSDKKLRQPLKEARSKRRAMALVDCPECGGARWQGSHCTGCGWRPRTRGDAVDIVDADLVPMQRDGASRPSDTAPEGKIAFYRQLLWIARERGYSDGWAWHKVSEKFGQRVNTPRGCQPLPPSDEVRAWVKSRAIAWARRRDRARGAEARGAA